MQYPAKIVPQPLRAVGIILCGLMLLVPAGVCWTGASPRIMAMMHFVIVISPLPFLILVQLCIDTGREREREERGRAEQEKQRQPL